jgi:DNA polymerase III subunit chi
MTRIDFYFNVADKQQIISELVLASINKHSKVTIFAENAEVANDISLSLWHAKQDGFLPNVLANHQLAEQTPVNIHWQDYPLLQNDTLINLTLNQPSFFSRFTQLVELVSNEEQDKMAARARFKFYRDRGYEIKSIDCVQI